MKYLIDLLLFPLYFLLSSASSTPPATLPPSSPPIIIRFAGDLMLDRHIRSIGEAKGYDYIFTHLTSWFNQADLVVANLEGPITTNRSLSLNSSIGSPQNYIFTFDPTVLPTLVANNIRLLNIGNNHILNFGQSGLASTIQYLNQANLDYFGDVSSSESRYRILTIKGMKIAFVNYNQFAPSAQEHTIADIAAVRPQSDIVFVYCHWGNEYQTTFNPKQQQLAHQFIDAGADSVIGTHPHVIQPSEIYHHKPIYYSLGNFVFDQYFSSATQVGLIVTFVIDSQLNIRTDEAKISIPPSAQINLWYANPK